MALSPEQEEEFGRVAGYLSNALAFTGNPPTHRLQDVREGIARGQYQLWAAYDSAILTELVIHPTGRKDVNFFLAGGNMAEIKTLHQIILAWAREQGCVYATCLGRPGWARTFITTEAGWKPTLTQYAKEL